MTAEKDIVLIYHEDQPVVFARVEDIEPDAKNRRIKPIHIVSPLIL